MGRLTSSGSSGALRKELFPIGFDGEVMALTLDTWMSFYRRQNLLLETRITAVFRDALIDAYDAAGKNWFVTLEDPITDPDYGTELGRNDIRFYPPHHRKQTLFFVVECKRLRVPTDSGFKHLAIEYVKEGMQRFVDGQYASGLPCGGMLGYVMDNQLDEAFDRVQEEMNANSSELRTDKTTPLQTPSSTLPKYRWSADTFHQRTANRLCIHHLLVSISPG